MTTREEHAAIDALLIENDLITHALANIDAGGVLFQAAISPGPLGPDFEPALPPALPMLSPTPTPVVVPFLETPSTEIMTALTALFTARQAVIQADLAAKGVDLGEA